MRSMMKSAVLVIIFTLALFLPMFTENAASEEVSDIEVIFTAVNPENNNTYHLLSEASWSESAQVARGLDGYLVTINDEQENQWLMDTFGNYDGQSRHLWTGLSDSQEEGSVQMARWYTFPIQKLGSRPTIVKRRGRLHSHRWNQYGQHYAGILE